MRGEDLPLLVAGFRQVNRSSNAIKSLKEEGAFLFIYLLVGGRKKKRVLREMRRRAYTKALMNIATVN